MPEPGATELALRHGLRMLSLRTPAPHPTLCAWTLARAPDDGPLVVLHELPENPGLPLARLFEPLTSLILNELGRHHASIACRQTLWFAHYPGMEDGMAESWLELLLEVRGDRGRGFHTRLRRELDVDAATRRHLRREMHRLGVDTEAWGCFNIS